MLKGLRDWTLALISGHPEAFQLERLPYGVIGGIMTLLLVLSVELCPTTEQQLKKRRGFREQEERRKLAYKLGEEILDARDRASKS